MHDIVFFLVGFHFRVNYELHRKKKHNIGKDTMFACDHCEKEFQAVGLLHRHQATVSRYSQLCRLLLNSILVLV